MLQYELNFITDKEVEIKTEFFLLKVNLNNENTNESVLTAEFDENLYTEETIREMINQFLEDFDVNQHLS